jgi:voltage-gated sodium channel
MRRKVKGFIENPLFDRSILFIIVLNTIDLGLETVPYLVQNFGSVLMVANLIFTAVYVIEAALKIFVYRGAYFKNGWNIFDFIIVITCLIPSGGAFGSVRIMRLLRVLRVLRALRLISGVKQLRKIVMTIIGALPGVGWAGVLMVLLYYVFSIIGIHLFSAEFPEQFGGFPQAFETLFELTTLEGWQDIVKPICEWEPFGWIYFLIFIVFASFILLNLVVGIVVDSIDEMSRQDAEEDAKENAHTLQAEIKILQDQMEKVQLLLQQQQGMDE